MLRGNQLIGFGGGGKGPASVSYVSTAEIDTNGTVFTYTSQSVGAAGPGRKVVVGVQTSASFSTLSATYGGAAMTQIAFDAAAGVAFFAIDEAAATTATIVITNSATITNTRIFVWNVYNGSATPRDTQLDTTLTSGHCDITLTCPAGSVALALAFYGDGAANNPTTTYSGLTERVDAVWGDSSGTKNSSAADGTFATATSQAVTATFTTAIPSYGGLFGIVL